MLRTNELNTLTAFLLFNICTRRIYQYCKYFVIKTNNKCNLNSRDFVDISRCFTALYFLPVLNPNRVYHRNPNISVRVSNNIINYFNTLLNYVDISAAVYIVTGSHRNRLDHVRLLVVNVVMNIMRASDTT